ncbi:serine protease [Gammaproteobacteria bacterium]|nr:serine protease [Gammaproteobacteria bacterium]
MRFLNKTLVVFFAVITFTINSQEPNLYEKAYPSVVAILGETSIGSGVIISKDGFILTNWHVIKDEPDFQVITIGEGSFEDNVRKAEIIKYSKVADLALIKIKTVPKDIQVASLSQVIPNIGDSVHAIGHPIGEVWSYSKGYISAHRQEYDWHIGKENFHGDVYQMQTPINPGNSGGPLLNDFGNVIGINTFINTKTQGITYAVTVEEILKFLIKY